MISLMVFDLVFEMVLYEFVEVFIFNSFDNQWNTSFFGSHDIYQLLYMINKSILAYGSHFMVKRKTFIYLDIINITNYFKEFVAVVFVWIIINSNTNAKFASESLNTLVENLNFFRIHGPIFSHFKRNILIVSKVMIFKKYF